MAKEPICPLIKDECLKHGCTFYTHVIGRDPQTLKEVDQFDCAIKWLPILLVEVSSKTRQNSAALESFKDGAVSALTRVGDVLSRRLEQLDPSPALPDQSSRLGRGT